MKSFLIYYFLCQWNQQIDSFFLFLFRSVMTVMTATVQKKNIEKNSNFVPSSKSEAYLSEEKSGFRGRFSGCEANTRKSSEETRFFRGQSRGFRNRYKL